MTPAKRGYSPQPVSKRDQGWRYPMDDRDERDQQQPQDKETGEPRRPDDAIDDLDLVREEGESVKGGQKRYADATKP